MTDTLTRGAGPTTAPRAEAALARLRELADVVQLTSLCGLGQAAPQALKSVLEHFPDALQAS